MSIAHRTQFAFIDQNPVLAVLSRVSSITFASVLINAIHAESVSIAVDTDTLEYVNHAVTAGKPGETVTDVVIDHVHAVSITAAYSEAVVHSCLTHQTSVLWQALAGMRVHTVHAHAVFWAAGFQAVVDVDLAGASPVPWNAAAVSRCHAESVAI